MTVDLVVELANKALLYRHINVSSGTYYFACDRSDRQHFSDRYVNPGADTYVCTEDRCSFL